MVAGRFQGGPELSAASHRRRRVVLTSTRIRPIGSIPGLERVAKRSADQANAASIAVRASALSANIFPPCSVSLPCLTKFLR